MLPCRDAQGIECEVAADHRARLEAIVADRDRRRKHVERARIVLLSADGVGTVSIRRQVGCAKATLWRWQERFMAAGVDGLLQDKSRPPGKTPLARGSGRAGGRSDARRAAWRGDPLDRPGAGRGGRYLAALGPADLGGARLAAAPGQALQAVQGPRVRRQAPGHRRSVGRSASPCGRAVGGTKRAGSRRSIGPSRACRWRRARRAR
jgi:Homeodomain-like domain